MTTHSTHATPSIHDRICAARAATLTLLERTLAAATHALDDPDAPPATLREARLAATAAARTLSALASTIPDDTPPTPPQPKPPPPPHRSRPPRDANSILPSGITIADLVAVLETPEPGSAMPPPPRKPRPPATPAALLSRVGALDPPRS